MLFVGVVTFQFSPLATAIASWINHRAKKIDEATNTVCKHCYV